MGITAFKRGISFLFFFLFLISGCALLQPEEKTLERLQTTVRRRLLALQVNEFLSGTAKERFQPGKAAEVFALGTGYQAGGQKVGSDPALQVLEDAICAIQIETTDWFTYSRFGREVFCSIFQAFTFQDLVVV